MIIVIVQQLKPEGGKLLEWARTRYYDQRVITINVQAVDLSKNTGNEIYKYKTLLRKLIS